MLTTSALMRIVIATPPISIIIMIVIILWNMRTLPPQVPLFYSRPWGEEQLTEPMYLFILPFSAIFWYIISILLIHLQTYQYRVFAQLLLITQAIMSLGMLYILLRIIILIT
jgi:hypothetical protein